MLSNFLAIRYIYVTAVLNVVEQQQSSCFHSYLDIFHFQRIFYCNYEIMFSIVYCYMIVYFTLPCIVYNKIKLYY